METRSPPRVILDHALRIPESSRLVQSARETPLWIMTSDFAEASRAMKLEAAGVHVMHVPVAAKAPGLDLAAILRTLSKRGVNRLMVEGGARVAASFVAAALVDEAWLLRGPDPIGDDGVAALGALPLTSITESPQFRVRASETLDQDALSIYERV
jgi:diaminohydroxyphosphoribosylaminopyrimidine deaminase/5-amino-6-(5-phosphoribosylamino)uracil reductase